MKNIQVGYLNLSPYNLEASSRGRGEAKLPAYEALKRPEQSLLP